MNTIRTLLIDDEPDAIQVLQLMLLEHPSVEVVGTALSADEGVELIQRLDPELVFLDVEMPQKSGFEVLRAVEKARFKVIFITAYSQYAITAIKYAALDYVLKPIDPEELSEAVSRVLEHLRSEDDRLGHLRESLQRERTKEQIIISSKKGFIALPVDEIVSIESVPGNYAFFFMANGTEFLCTKPLGYYEELLSESGFHRIHRSYLVNLQHVKTFDNGRDCVLMSNQKQLPVAARRRAKFRHRFLSRFTR